MRDNYLENLFQNKKLKIIVAIAILIIVITGLFYIIDSQIQKSQPPSYAELQNKCSLETKQFADNLQNGTSIIQYTYTNHYSANLKTCYILVHGIGITGVGTSDRLTDIYNNKDIVDCESYGTAPDLNSCIYNGSTGAYNLNNFKDFIRAYMENY